MNNGIVSGSFTSTGANVTLKIRSGVDWIKVLNYTQYAAVNNGYGFEYNWQNGMGTTTLMKYHPAGDHTSAVNTSASSIEVIDSSNYAIGANVAITGGTDVTQPVYSTASTAGMVDGTIVRINSTDHDNLNGLDFTVDNVVANTSFTPEATLATQPGRIAGGNGYYRIIAPNIEIYRMFTPSDRNIADISQAATPTVTTLVDHGYSAGQRVRLRVPAECGMIQLDGVTANITSVTNAFEFVIDVDTTAFTAFTFPVYGDVPFTPARVIPMGTNPGYSGYMDAPGKFYNQGYTGVVLTGGTTYPAGNNNDVIYWWAGTSEVEI